MHVLKEPAAFINWQEEYDAIWPEKDMGCVKTCYYTFNDHKMSIRLHCSHWSVPSLVLRTLYPYAFFYMAYSSTLKTREQIPPKYWYLPTKLQSVTSQKRVPPKRGLLQYYSSTDYNTVNNV
jgi:hypothetical protein